MYIKVRVVPSAKKEKWEQESETVFAASVKEPAERNLANARVRELVAAHFQLPIGKVRLISGHRSPQKVFSVDL